MTPDDRGAQIVGFRFPVLGRVAGTTAVAATTCGFLLGAAWGVAVGIGAGVVVAAGLGAVLHRRWVQTIVVYERGFSAGARFVPWSMIQQIEGPDPESASGAYLIRLDFGGGSIFIPDTPRGRRAMAAIERQRLRLPPGD